jgi:hypothetical protein
MPYSDHCRIWVRRTGVLPVVAVLAGCAWGTDAEPTGTADQYTVSQTYAPIRGGLPRAEAEARALGNAQCRSLGREFYPLRETTIAWPPTYRVLFTCVDIGGGA